MLDARDPSDDCPASSRGPLVSVVIPAYEAAETIGAAIQSVLDQTYRRTEILVVVDGPCDGTHDIARSFGARVHPAHERRGMAAARNVGLKHARGELIAFLDADDRWLPPKLEEQVEALARDPEAHAAYCGLSVRDERTGSTHSQRAESSDNVLASVLTNPSFVPGPASTVLVRAATAELFDVDLGYSPDLDYVLRLAQRGRFVAVQAPLVVYSARAGSMSSNLDRLSHETFKILRSFFSSPGGSGFRALRRRSYGAFSLAFAGMAVADRNPWRALRWMARAVAWHPPNAARIAAAAVRRARRGTAQAGAPSASPYAASQAGATRSSE